MSLDLDALRSFVSDAPGLMILLDGDGRRIASTPSARAAAGPDIEVADAALQEATAEFKDGEGRKWRAARLGEDAVLLSAAEGPDASQRFTAAVSHEIRTPLNGILGMVALLEETPLAPVQQEYAAAIRNSGSRLLDLLNNVLDYSRFEAGDVQLDETPFDPRELIQDVAELISPRAHSAGLDVAAVASRRLAASFAGDVGRLRQILFNLAGNAVKFTTSGGVLIGAQPGPDGAGLRLSVYDTGPGIPAEARDDLFRAFSQVSAADAGRDGGVGLGLAIVAQLADAMGGRVSVDCGPGGGAIFHLDAPLVPVASPPPSPPDIEVFAGRRILLDLPPASNFSFLNAFAAVGARAVAPDDTQAPDLSVVDAACAPRRIEHLSRIGPTLVVLRPEDRSLIPKFRDLGAVGYLIRPMRARSILTRARLAITGHPSRRDTSDAPAEADQKPPQKGVCVLIADDNPVNALLAKRALEADGHRVDVAGSGAEALEAAAAVRYSVVFMDVRMPIMDGLEATRRIRALDHGSANTPIIAVTADVDAQLEAKAAAAGVTLVASKPIDPARLRALAADWALPEPATS